jgi:hypothetical protein
LRIISLLKINKLDFQTANAATGCPYAQPCRDNVNAGVPFLYTKNKKSGGTLFTVVSRRFYVFFRAFSAASVVQFFVIRTDGACLHSRFKISPGDYFETGNPADQGGFPAAVCPLFHGCARFRV